MSISTHIRISQEAKDRLDKRRHRGQSYDGIILELLDKTEPPSSKERKKNTRR